MRFPSARANLALTLDPRSARVNGDQCAPPLQPALLDTYAGAVASVLNISGYLFTRIDDPHGLRSVLRDRAVAAELKGTILLAEEGINLLLAGEADAMG